MLVIRNPQKVLDLCYSRSIEFLASFISYAAADHLLASRVFVPLMTVGLPELCPESSNLLH